MKIAIAGYGVVGRGTHELLLMNRDKIAARAGEEIEVRALRQSSSRHRASRRSWLIRK